MNDRQRQRKADDLADLATRCAAHLCQVDAAGRTVVNRIRDAMLGQPGAQNLEGDRTTGHTTVTDEMGFPMPSVSDPTGEAAIRHDRAAAHLKEFDRVLQRAASHMERAVDILANYTPRPATDAEQRELELDNEPGCQSCQRVGEFEPIFRPNTNPGGNLTHPKDLCYWCWRWTFSAGRLPTVDELALHHSGRSVKPRA